MSQPSSDSPVVKPDSTYTVATGKVHKFRAPGRVMSISFILESAGQVESEYPKYLLESTDGAYSKQLSPKNDLVPYDQYLQLRFEDLRRGREYTLTRINSSSHRDVIFREVPYDMIIDQERSTHEPLDDHQYALGDVEFGDSVDVEPWNMDRA
jgi:hypothetical protein